MERIACIFLALFTLIAPLSYSQTTWVTQKTLNEGSGTDKAFSFIHITDIHIGESDPDGDFGSPGFLDDTVSADNENFALRSLRRAVEWINAYHEGFDVRFVIISGDLTDSGERSEYLRLKEVLSKLQIPYVPLIGNHDVWPYTGNIEAARPVGDSMINVIFEDVFDSLRLFFDEWDDGQRLSRTWNPEGQTWQYLQNFSFVYDNYRFILTDFNPRYHVRNNPGAPGIGPEAQIMDYTDGTWPWVQDQFNNMTDPFEENVIMVSHHPPMRDFIGAWYAFDPNELFKIKSFLFDYRDKLALWLAGHIHRTFENHLISWDAIYEICHLWETDATKDHQGGHFRIIDVYEREIPTSLNEFQSDKLDIFPNPSGDVLTVGWKRHWGEMISCRIFDQLGRPVDAQPRGGRSVTSIQLDVSRLAPGTYHIHLTFNGTTLTRSFIKT